jgi:hypothetical protein
MFPDRYFAKRHYPNRYFPPGGAVAPTPAVQQDRRPTYGSKGEYPEWPDHEELLRRKNNELALAFLLDEF